MNNQIESLRKGYDETMNNQIESLRKSYDETMNNQIENLRKGYPVASGYKGWTGKKYMLFETEGAYEEYIRGE